MNNNALQKLDKLIAYVTEAVSDVAEEDTPFVSLVLDEMKTIREIMPYVHQNENSQSVVTDPALVFNYDLDAAPKNHKLMLLTVGKIAVTGYLVSNISYSEQGYIAWHAIPVRDKDKEKELGYAS